MLKISIRLLFRGLYRRCGCGYCDYLIPIIDKYGIIRKYKKGHNHNGDNNKNFKGRVKNGDYWYLYKPEHPMKISGNYVAEHRIFYEQYYHVCLLSWTDIHHRDGNKENNFDINNLEPIFRPDHTRIHRSGNHNPWKKNR